MVNVYSSINSNALRQAADGEHLQMDHFGGELILIKSEQHLHFIYCFIRSKFTFAFSVFSSECLGVPDICVGFLKSIWKVLSRCLEMVERTEYIQWLIEYYIFHEYCKLFIASRSLGYDGL